MDYEKKYKEALKRARANYKADKEMGFLENCDMLELIFPELAESEDEDERIRKSLVQTLQLAKRNDGKLVISNTLADKYLAWLEKQKEPHKRLRDKTPWIVTAKEELAHAEERLQANLEELHRIRAEKEKQKEQEPAWSEEDQKSLNRAINICISDFGEECETARFLKSLPERFTLQPKQEWGEEDKKMLLSIINAFRNGTVSTIGQEQWLKNLPKRINPQPKPEWSEEDGEMLDAMVDMVANSLYEPLCPRDKMYYWLKSLRPSWKPSEEQMEALEAATVRYQSTGLESLYEDLKKV